jgi:hypothetical protein
MRNDQTQDETPEPHRRSRRQSAAHAPFDAQPEQVKLGEAFGVTFQQVQKYEKGVNRMGSSRFVSSEDGVRLIKAFARITRPAVRLVAVVREIAGDDGQ